MTEFQSFWKPPRKDKAKPKPIGQSKAFKQRAEDKKSLLEREPATHEELHFCYIGAHWVKRFDLEHVVDASERPDLRDNPKNHKKACNKHNIAKKLGNLTESEQARVDKARAEVLR